MWPSWFLPAPFSFKIQVFSAKTIFLKLISSGFRASRRDHILSKGNIKVSKVLDPCKGNYKTSDSSIEMIMDKLGINSEGNYNPLQTSADNDFYIQLKRAGLFPVIL